MFQQHNDRRRWDLGSRLLAALCVQQAEKRRLMDQQTPEVLRLVGRESKGDHGPERVAENVGGAEAEMINQRGEVVLTLITTVLVPRRMTR